MQHLAAIDDNWTFKVSLVCVGSVLILTVIVKGTVTSLQSQRVPRSPLVWSRC